MNNETRDAIRGVVAGMRQQKAAEARFTLEEQAFAAGFCKAAEAMGVDPAALAKVAAPPVPPQRAVPQPGQQPQQLPQQVAENFPARGGTSAFGNDFMERLGQWATLGEGTALGAALGSRRANRWLGKLRLRGIKGKGIGAVAGLTAGALANMLGRGKAFFTRGRTAQDQIDYDQRFRWANLLTPGAGAYNNAKRKERVQLSRWHG